MARRALLTDAEREALMNPESRDNPYVAVSRVRKKIREELPHDIEVLREHDSDLFEELQELVCEEDIAAEDSHRKPRTEPITDDVTDTGAKTEIYQELGDDTFTGLELPGSGEKLEKRQRAVREAFEYVKEHGKATPSDLKDDIYPDHDGGYASARSWWKNLVYPAFGELADGYGVLERADTAGVWTYTGGAMSESTV